MCRFRGELLAERLGFAGLSGEREHILRGPTGLELGQLRSHSRVGSILANDNDSFVERVRLLAGNCEENLELLEYWVETLEEDSGEFLGADGFLEESQLVTAFNQEADPGLEVGPTVLLHGSTIYLQT
jgi:hypothetical protein